jgi:hypothetical protein
VFAGETAGLPAAAAHTVKALAIFAVFHFFSELILLEHAKVSEGDTK